MNSRRHTPVTRFRELLPRSLRITFAAFLSASLIPATLQAESSSWNVNSNGAWNNENNWLDNVIPGSTETTDNQDIATFDFTLTGARTVTVDANRNIAGIRFGNTSGFGYTLGGNGPIILSNGGTIETLTTNGNHQDTISVPILLAGAGGTATISSNAILANSRLVISGEITGQATAGNVTVLTINGSNTSNNNRIGNLLDGPNGGKLAVVKEGAGTWTITHNILPDNGAFSGGLTINQGTIRLTAGSNASLGAGPLTLNGGTLLYQTAVGRIQNSMSSVTVGGDFHFISDRNNAGVGFNHGLAAPTTIGAHTLTFTVGNNVSSGTAGFFFNGNINLTGNAVFNVIRNEDAGMLLTFGASASHKFDTNGHTIALEGTGDVLIRADITGSGQLLKENEGILTVTSDNTFTGDTIINEGILVISNVGASSSVEATLTSGSTIVTVADTSVFTVGQAITSIPASYITRILSNTQFTMSIPATTSGETELNFGGTNGSLSGSTVDYQSTGGSIQFGGTTSSTSFGGLKGDKDLLLQNTASTPGAVALTLGGNNQSNTYSGVLSGPGSIIKVGTGTQTFTAENTYTGGTIINEGIILANSPTGSSLGSGTVTIGADGTLGGIGRVAPSAGNDIIVDGRISPGANSVGTLTFALNEGSQLIFNENSILEFTLGTASDLILFETTGDWLTGSGNVTLNLTLGEGFDYENSYVIFENVITDGFTLADVTGIDKDLWTYSFTREGNNYVLSFNAIPEPSVIALGTLGLAAVLFLRRRTRA